MRLENLVIRYFIMEVFCSYDSTQRHPTLICGIGDVFTSGWMPRSDSHVRFGGKWTDSSGKTAVTNLRHEQLMIEREGNLS